MTPMTPIRIKILVVIMAISSRRVAIIAISGEVIVIVAACIACGCLGRELRMGEELRLWWRGFGGGFELGEVEENHFDMGVIAQCIG